MLDRTERPQQNAAVCTMASSGRAALQCTGDIGEIGGLGLGEIQRQDRWLGMPRRDNLVVQRFELRTTRPCSTTVAPAAAHARASGAADAAAGAGDQNHAVGKIYARICRGVAYGGIGMGGAKSHGNCGRMIAHKSKDPRDLDARARAPRAEPRCAALHVAKRVMRGLGARIIRFRRPGAIAQLGERLHGMQEVSGSIPLISTTSAPQVGAMQSCPYRLEA